MRAIRPWCGCGMGVPCGTFGPRGTGWGGTGGRWRGGNVRAWCGRSRDFMPNGVGFPLSLLTSRISVSQPQHAVLQHAVLCCHIQLIWSRGIYLAARWFLSGKMS